jgi:hypothetical protein
VIEYAQPGAGIKRLGRWAGRIVQDSRYRYDRGETAPRASVRSIVYRCSSPECRPVIECAYASTAAAAGVERLGPWAAQQLAVHTHNTGYRIEAVEIPVSVEHGSHSRSHQLHRTSVPPAFASWQLTGRTTDHHPEGDRQADGQTPSSELRSPSRVAAGPHMGNATWLHAGRWAISGQRGLGHGIKTLGESQASRVPTSGTQRRRQRWAW